MRPAWSIIFFTVLSGSGLGLAAVLPFIAYQLPLSELLKLAVLAVVLLIAGLLSSTGHLANPKNAWRAVFRLRSSWLSREAVLALLFFPVFVIWLVMAWRQHPAAVWLAVLVIVIAVATVFCTAMIYASLKTVPQWRHALTPINYLLLSALSGVLMVAAILPAQPLILSSLFLLLPAALIGKLAYFRIVRKTQTVAEATALSAGRVRLLDAGHTAANFLTREFVYHPAAAQVRVCRWMMWGLVFAMPAAALLLLTFFPAWQWVWGGVLPLFFAGVLAERWLFFAEAKHVVRLYHGAN